MFSFGKNSLDKLKGVHPDLVRVINKALGYGVLDFAVVQGVRTKAEQEKLYAQGRDTEGPIVTWTKDSKHIAQYDGFGHAVDLVPFVKGKIDWIDLPNFYLLGALMFRAAMETHAEIVWGGFWTQKDYPHFEIIT